MVCLLNSLTSVFNIYHAVFLDDLVAPAFDLPNALVSIWLPMSAADSFFLMKNAGSSPLNSRRPR